MASAQVWKRRVAAWRAGGRSSEEFCKGKAFTAGGLRYWASRLGRETGSRKREPVIRIGRVLRKPASVEATSTGPERVGDKRHAIVVELDTARVTVQPGFDRPTLAAVLDVLASRGGRP
jgi:hypothetical protein